jgi:hypothetical protein
MSSGWVEMKWHVNDGTKRRRKRPDDLVGSAAGPPRRRQPGTAFNLAKEATAMMHRNEFNDSLVAWARTEPRGAVVYAVTQALLGELRRVGCVAFLDGNAECLVRVRAYRTLQPRLRIHTCSRTCNKRARDTRRRCSRGCGPTASSRVGAAKASPTSRQVASTNSSRSRQARCNGKASRWPSSVRRSTQSTWPSSR